LPSCYKKSSNIFVSFRKKFILFFRLKAKKLFKLQMAQIGLALKSLVFRYTKTKIDLFCLSFPLVLKTASIVSIFFAARLQQNYRLGGLTRSVLKTLIRCSELRGVVLKCSGRFTRAQRAKRMTVSANIKRIRPLGTFTALVDYAFKVAYLRNGACGIKV